MDDVIKIENMSFAYGNNQIFNDFNLVFKRGSWTALIGPNSGGKSTLFKILMGELKHQGTVLLDGQALTDNNHAEYYKKIYLLNENPDDKFISETVQDEIAFVLENKRKTADEITETINEIAEKLNIKHLLNKSPYQLSGGEKQIVCIAAMLAHEPEVVLMDETLNRIDFAQKNEIMALIDKLRQEKNLTIITITHNLEEIIGADSIVVLDQGKIVLKGATEKVFAEEKILNRLGVEIPFMVSLSLKLKYYNLIDEIETDMDKMVKKIWL